MKKQGSSKANKQPLTVAFKYHTRDIGQKKVDGVDRDHMRWRVVLETPAYPNAIEKVVFHLHESFKPPEIEVAEPPFQVEQEGWGEFTLVANIIFKKGSGLRKDTLNVEHRVAFPEPGKTEMLEDQELVTRVSKSFLESLQPATAGPTKRSVEKADSATPTAPSKKRVKKATSVEELKRLKSRIETLKDIGKLREIQNIVSSHESAIHTQNQTSTHDTIVFDLLRLDDDAINNVKRILAQD